MNYVDSFLKLKESCSDSYTLFGDCILVERIKSKELKTKTGIYLPKKDMPTSNQVKAMTPDYSIFVKVLMVGEGYYDSDKEIHIPLDVKEGDVVLVGQQSVQWFSVFGELADSQHHSKIGITREDQIKLKLKGDKAYDKFFTSLNDYLNDENKVS